MHDVFCVEAHIHKDTHIYMYLKWKIRTGLTPYVSFLRCFLFYSFKKAGDG